jgi:hypothetical protein
LIHLIRISTHVDDPEPESIVSSQPISLRSI